MANKGFAYGLSAQVARKIEGKRNPKKEAEVQHWIETITECKFDDSESFEGNLRNGILLCKLVNKIKPKAVKKISESEKPFNQDTTWELAGFSSHYFFRAECQADKMENINNFLTSIEKYGVPKTDLFQTVDLYEASNIPAVTATLFALGRICQTKPEWKEGSPSYKHWPILGPKQAEEHVREFDEETIQEGKKIIGIQAGTNKLASQAGQSFGGRRQVS